MVACVILAGGLRPSPLVAATGRSILDLWLTPHGTVLDCWVDRIREISEHLGKKLPIRVAHDSTLPMPWPSSQGSEQVVIEQEPRPMRGPAGIVHDLCRDYAPHQFVLVVEAARYASVPLMPLLERHADRDAHITVAANPDRSPAGIYLIRCDALQLVPNIGFMDLKEQWLQRAAKAGFTAIAHPMPAPGSLPLHTRTQLLAAARLAAIAGGEVSGKETWADGIINGERSGGFRVICPGAIIGPGAIIADSIIMPGAAVGRDSTIVRSLLCPNCRIQARTDIADAVVNAGGCLPDSGCVCA